MTFYYHGRKKSGSGLDFLSGCFLFIGFGAIIYLFTLLDSIEDLKEHWWPLLLVLIMAASVLIGIFRKKGKLSRRKISLKDGYLHMDQFSAAVNTLTLDEYTKDGAFERYHLWDSQGKIAVFSVYPDALSAHFKAEFPEQCFTHKVSISSGRGSSVRVTTTQKRLFGYDLDGGDYYIVQDKEAIAKFTPQTFAYDPKYSV